MCHGPINFDPDKLFSLQFNPLDRRYNLAHFSDSDRDENFSPESFNCKYYIEDEFNESLANNVRNENYLSFLQRNICSHSFHGLMNSINWPASSVWVFIAQLGEHCSANAEATGSNPIEAPKTFFSGYFRNCLNCDSLRWSHTHFICSLAGNFDRLLLLLANVHLQFSCIGISETWLQNSLHNCDIPGYNFVHSPRLHKAGGGVCIYVTKELEFKMRDDFALSESLFIEVI